MRKNFKQLIATIGLFSLLLTGCSSNNNFSNNNLLPNEPDPVAWINKDGIKYYYFISELDIDENSLYYTGEKTDSDDAIEVGKKIYKNEIDDDSLYIEFDGQWAQYKTRESE
ncbi:hypothetical protein [Paenibacillus sp. FSL R7-0331]|uniref:hypothetical protein n=1 Tax=Paenibacillus sp. FSL R7-0331 TaxID=1536773 RepID=UPI0004F5DCA8|nr:hypothetical protein [Paenibacillus sp. FSL R7-0331]AIQ54108.1 hypothetical protein R70331_22965 [Paenibacillus sp. FSL R7-0331]